MTDDPRWLDDEQWSALLARMPGLMTEYNPAAADDARLRGLMDPDPDMPVPGGAPRPGIDYWKRPPEPEEGFSARLGRIAPGDLQADPRMAIDPPASYRDDAIQVDPRFPMPSLEQNRLNQMPDSGWWRDIAYRMGRR